MRTEKIGIIGCGNISSAYLRTVQAFSILECVARQISIWIRSGAGAGMACSRAQEAARGS